MTGHGPYWTERDALNSPAVRRAHTEADRAADATGTHAGSHAEPNLAMLLGACKQAGVEVGDYDRRILTWLANWEATTCASVAGLIVRAAGGEG